MIATTRRNPWTRVTTATAAVLALSAAIAVTTRTWAGDDNHPRPASQESADDVADQILQLRKQVGGSNLDTLDAFSPLPTGDEENPDALRQTPEAPDVFRNHIRHLHESAGTSQRYAADGPVEAVAPASRTGRVKALRDAALLIDRAAHRLECVDEYEQADALRRSADSLRHEARNLRPMLPQP
ncbi:MAG: hypothetical protein WDZ59_03615 [Pirellulales bacterium]